MPTNSSVHKLYEKLLAKGFSKASSARIAQAKTGLALATGQPPKTGPKIDKADMNSFMQDFLGDENVIGGRLRRAIDGAIVAADQQPYFSEITKNPVVPKSKPATGNPYNPQKLDMMPEDRPIPITDDAGETRYMPPLKPSKSLIETGLTEAPWEYFNGGWVQDAPATWHRRKAKEDLDKSCMEKYCKLGLSKEQAEDAMKRVAKYEEAMMQAYAANRFDEPIYTDPKSPFYLGPASTDPKPEVAPEVKPLKDVSLFVGEKSPTTAALKSIEKEQAKPIKTVTKPMAKETIINYDMESDIINQQSLTQELAGKRHGYKTSKPQASDKKTTVTKYDAIQKVFEEIHSEEEDEDEEVSIEETMNSDWVKEFNAAIADIEPKKKTKRGKK